MVKERYSRYYFEDVKEYEEYRGRMDGKEQLKGQRNKRYDVGSEWVSLIDWGVVRGVDWIESLMNKVFRNHVVSKLVKFTISLHSPPP